MQQYHLSLWSLSPFIVLLFNFFIIIVLILKIMLAFQIFLSLNCKSWQMQFRNKTVYVWGLCYRWDPSLSRDLIPRSLHFVPPCSELKRGNVSAVFYSVEFHVEWFEPLVIAWYSLLQSSGQWGDSFSRARPTLFFFRFSGKLLESKYFTFLGKFLLNFWKYL